MGRVLLLFRGTRVIGTDDVAAAAAAATTLPETFISRNPTHFCRNLLFPVYLFHFFRPNTRYRHAANRLRSAENRTNAFKKGPCRNGTDDDERKARARCRYYDGRARIVDAAGNPLTESSPNFSPSKRQSLRKN